MRMLPVSLLAAALALAAGPVLAQSAAGTTGNGAIPGEGPGGSGAGQSTTKGPGGPPSTNGISGGTGGVGQGAATQPTGTMMAKPPADAPAQ